MVGSLLLLGCAGAPERLGVTNLEWASYSQDKQKELLLNYHQITKKRKGIVVKPGEGKRLSNVYLVVKIYDGKVMFPPAFINWQNYQPVQFMIFKDECLNIEVAHSVAKDSKTELGACFYDNVLYLDPSRYDTAKDLGSITIHRSPLWSTGFAYQGISSSGYVRLNNVTVEIAEEKIELK